MTIHTTTDSKSDTTAWVDAAWGGTETGSSSQPYATIAAAIAGSAAGDVITVKPGAYVEDLAFAAGEDMTLRSMSPGSVTITGSMTVTDATVTLEGLNLIDDGAGIALHFTGTGVDVLTMTGCVVDSTATGGVTFSMDNTAGTVEINSCQLNGDVGNANEVMQVESGTLDIRHSDVTHGSNVAEALVSEGDAATAILAIDCRFVGSINDEAAVIAAAAHDYQDCVITVGAISGVICAATCTIGLADVEIASTDAANDAVDGAGTIGVGGQVVFPSTADEFATTLTVTRLPTNDSQVGVVAAAGASPQTDTVTLPQPYSDVNYSAQLTFEATGGGADDVICSIDQGTIAEAGFDVITTSASAAAIAGNIHWLTKRTA